MLFLFNTRDIHDDEIEAVWSTRYRDHFRGVHSDASPALLCHKEPAQGTQSPLLGALGRKPPTRGFLAFRWFFMA